jgi:ferrous iron transport protein B
MARAAFLMDRLMHRLGLDGKAFISILLGYGCNVPAVMGTRILTSRYSRILTMLLIPFTLCTARLQIFVFLTAIFFPPKIAPWIILSLYVCSFVAVILTGLVLKLFRIGGSPEPFIMEIPPYRLPTLRSISLRTWYELKDFLSRAATLIMAGVLIVWLLIHMPADVPPASAATWAGQLGQMLAPVFQPLGIDWQETVSLIFGFIAKEIVVGGLAAIYGGADLTIQMSNHITPLQSISFMLFCLLYTPCVATIAAIWSESRSIKITLLSLISGLAIGWMTSFIFYQAGLLLGFY